MVKSKFAEGDTHLYKFVSYHASDKTYYCSYYSIYDESKYSKDYVQRYCAQ